jgi:hypothetical protein
MATATLPRPRWALCARYGRRHAHNESVPIRVTLAVEVDGHVLRFEHEGRAWGARFYGRDPEKAGFPKGSSLEDAICITADTCFTEVTREAETLLGQMYPVVEQPDAVTDS